MIVLNSCVVRQAAEDKVAGKIGSLARVKRARPDVRIALTGCMVTGQERKLRERFPHVDLFFEPSDFDRLTEIVPELSQADTDLAELPHYYQPISSHPGVSAFIPIIYGCNFVCSYCIVPSTRGREVSRPLAELVEEVNRDPRRGEDHATSLSKIPLDPISLAVLAEQGYTPESVPPAGQRVLIRRNANLSTGGTAEDVTDRVHPEVAARCVDAARMVGLDVAGIDVVERPDAVKAKVGYLPEYLYQEPWRVLRSWVKASFRPGYWRAFGQWIRDLLRDPTPNRARRLPQRLQQQPY